MFGTPCINCDTNRAADEKGAEILQKPRVEQHVSKFGHS
jgi:hypothetical protein